MIDLWPTASMLAGKPRSLTSLVDELRAVCPAGTAGNGVALAPRTNLRYGK